MKKLFCSVGVILAYASITFAGLEGYAGKEVKTTTAPAPCPQWYADQEWYVNLWGTYVFTGNEWREDRYIQADHAWGGGLEIKYFFHRYFGIGLEGSVVDARREFEEATGVEVFQSRFEHENRAIGSVLGTVTLRYPIPCSRFSPYVFAGGGAIFGGGERERFNVTLGILPSITTDHLGSRTEGIGQFGGGLEIRITPHIGWMSDFSWNVVNGREDNFGMARSGINFAF